MLDNVDGALMKGSLLLVGLAGIAHCLSALAIHIWPEFICLALWAVSLLILIVLLVASIFLGFARWKKVSKLWYAPPWVASYF